MRKFLLAGAGGALALIVVALSSGVVTAGVTGPAFYVDGTVYRTVGTPAQFANTGAPAHSFDLIYDLGGTASTQDLGKAIADAI